MASKLELREYSDQYGLITGENKIFNDGETVKPNLHRLSSVKIFYSLQDNKKNVTGIQFIYKNLVDGEIFSPGAHVKKIEGFDELKLGPGEYINFFTVAWDTKINQIIFGTNKRERLEYGEKKGEEMLNDLKEKKFMIVSCFGGFTDDLNTLGMNYVELIEYYKLMTCGYFELKALIRNKEKWEKRKKELTLSEQDQVLVRVCQLPDAAFGSVIKYCIN